MDVRVKLHINKANDDEEYYDDNQENNLWMSINYDLHPTINDIVNKIRKHINGASDMYLYLDNYWLPAWENSRILRDNDSVKYA